MLMGSDYRVVRRIWSALCNPLVPYACAILFVLAITVGAV